MSQSLHNFFFVSFDPGGFISVDKPPVGFWIQTLSAWIFGFKGWSILAPEALAGVVAVFLLYRLVARVYGHRAGLIAALVLALTPITVATSRNNTIDSILVVAMLAAAWALLRATETARTSWLLLAAALLGVAFNVKFAEAFVALPAFIVAYLCVRSVTLRRKLGQLALAALVLTGVSLSWALAVDAVPAAARPWVGSTQSNSEVNLAFGYDGLQRVIGRFSPLARTLGGGGVRTVTEAGRTFVREVAASPAAREAAAFFRGGRFGGAAASPWLRLFSGALGQQIGWLLPLAVVAAVVVAVSAWRRRDGGTAEWPSAALWVTWLATTLVYFSVVPPLHDYYLVTMAPAVAAVIALGVTELGRMSISRGWQMLIAGFAVAGTAAFELHLAGRALPVDLASVVSVAAVAAAVAFGVRGLRGGDGGRWLRRAGAIAAALSLLLAPAYWAAATLGHPANGSDPTAGPAAAGARFFGGFGGDAGAADPQLVSYLTSQYHGGYLVATVNATTAAPIILQTGLPVMAMGGFLGSDPAISPSQLAALAASGGIKYFLIPGQPAGFGGGPATEGARGGEAAAGGAGSSGSGSDFAARRGPGFGGFGGYGGQTAVLDWILQHSKPVPASAWGGGGTQPAGGFGDRGRAMQLYEYTGPTAG